MAAHRLVRRHTGSGLQEVGVRLGPSGTVHVLHMRRVPALVVALCRSSWPCCLERSEHPAYVCRMTEWTEGQTQETVCSLPSSSSQMAENTSVLDKDLD